MSRRPLSLLGLALLPLCLAACQATPPRPPAIGGGLDAQGCNSAAHQRWSAQLQRCAGWDEVPVPPPPQIPASAAR